jgi:hypothetical protein
LTSIVIPSNVTEIEPYAFQNCSALAKIIIFPDSNAKISTYAFESCPLLSHIQTLAKFKQYAAIEYCSAPDSFSEEAKKLFAGYMSKQSTKLVPMIIDDENIVALKYFGDCELLSLKNIDTFIEYANNKSTECLAYLMNYKNSRFTRD